MLHLHISSESVLKGNPITMLRGYVIEKPIDNLEPLLEKPIESVKNAVVIEPISIGLQQNNVQNMIKSIINKAANYSSGITSANGRLRGQMTTLVETSVKTTTEDKENSELSHTLSMVETNTLLNKDSLPIQIINKLSEPKESIRVTPNSTLLVLSQSPARDPPHTLDNNGSSNRNRNRNSTSSTGSIEVGLSKSQSSIQKIDADLGANNRSVEIVQTEVMPTVSPTVLITQQPPIESRMPISTSPTTVIKQQPPIESRLPISPSPTAVIKQQTPPIESISPSPTAATTQQPSVAPVMPIAPPLLNSLVTNNSNPKISEQGCGHGLSCNSFSSNDLPILNKGLISIPATGLTSNSTIEPPSEIPTPYPTLAPTFSPSSTLPSQVTTTSPTINLLLTAASMTTTSPPTLTPHASNSTTASPTIDSHLTSASKTTSKPPPPTVHSQSNSSLKIVPALSTADSQSPVPSTASSSSPTAKVTNSSSPAKTTAATSSSKAGPLVVVVNNPAKVVEATTKPDNQQQVSVVVEKKPFVIDMQVEESSIKHPTLAPTAATTVAVQSKAAVEITVREKEILTPAQAKMDNELLAQIKIPAVESRSDREKVVAVDRQEAPQPQPPQQVEVVGDGEPAADSNAVDRCKGNVDPFEEQSIEHFKPPASAPFDKVRALLV